MEAVSTARDVLTALEGARASMGMSKAELARRGRLPAETVRRLLTSRKANPQFSLVADLLRPTGLGLFVGKVEVPAEELPAAPELVQAWLAHLGAPLYGSTAVKAADVPSAERVWRKRCPSRVVTPTVARALPAAFYRTRKRLDFSLLRRLARERGQGRTLGFFLELAAELSGDTGLREKPGRSRSATPSEACVAVLQVAERDGTSARCAEDAARRAPLGLPHEHVGR